MEIVTSSTTSGRIPELFTVWTVRALRKVFLGLVAKVRE
jgi:hypothetical protein